MDRLMLVFGAASMVTGMGLIVDTRRTWSWYGVRVGVPDGATIPSVCYGAAVLGEGTLQLLSAMNPEMFFPSTLAFMLPYKVASALGLGVAWWRGHIEGREAGLVAVQWLAPVLAIGTILALDVRGRSPVGSGDSA